MLYIDKLFEIAANAIDKRVFDMRPMTKFIEEYANLPECPKDNVVNRQSHTISSIPDFIICEDYYRTEVVPSQKAGSQLAQSFSVKATFQHWRTVLRGSIIGTVIGAIPGEGGTVAAFLSYGMTVQASDDPESFGKGNIQGVIAPEAAINAKDGSALIPTIAFGIPSGAEMAVFLGILVLHGMQPGPLMLAQNQNEI